MEGKEARSLADSLFTMVHVEMSGSHFFVFFKEKMVKEKKKVLGLLGRRVWLKEERRRDLFIE